MSNEPTNRKTAPGNGAVVVATGASGNVVLDPPIYLAFCEHNGGFLPIDKSAHALFHYFCTAATIYKSEREDVKLEGDAGRTNLHGLFLGVAKLYGVDPNDMEKYWPAVDLQARQLGVTLLPKENKWRCPRKGLN